MDEPRPDAPGAGGTLPRAYFDALYERSEGGDPWRFATSPYEAAKYAATLGHLPRPSYARALEVGCSIGVFTRLLADRAGDLLAVDIAPAALERARARCRDRPHVRFARVDLLDGVPPGPFDLITLAEVGYYWTPADLESACRRLAAELAPGGQLLLVHWRAAVPDYPMTGDEVHGLAARLAPDLGLNPIGRWAEAEYRTDLWERRPSPPGPGTGVDAR